MSIPAGKLLATVLLVLGTLTSWPASGQTSDKKDTGQISDNKDVSEKDKEAKRKLKGGFRGHSVDPSSPTETRDVHPPAAAAQQDQQATEKQKPLVINNAMVKSKESAAAPA